MIRKIGKIRKIRDLAELPRRLPGFKFERIPVRPAPRFGPAEDPLERAALQGVPGTLPERIVWRWLETEGHLYEVGRTELGGRLVVGGAVVDFVVYSLAPAPVALRVQGTYWHGPEFPRRQARDDEQRDRLTAQGYIVVDLWEHDIYEAVRHDRLTAYILDEVISAA